MLYQLLCYILLLLAVLGRCQWWLLLCANSLPDMNKLPAALKFHAKQHLSSTLTLFSQHCWEQTARWILVVTLWTAIWILSLLLFSSAIARQWNHQLPLCIALTGWFAMCPVNRLSSQVTSSYRTAQNRATAHLIVSDLEWHEKPSGP